MAVIKFDVNAKAKRQLATKSREETKRVLAQAMQKQIKESQCVRHLVGGVYYDTCRHELHNRIGVASGLPYGYTTTIYEEKVVKPDVTFNLVIDYDYKRILVYKRVNRKKGLFGHLASIFVGKDKGDLICIMQSGEYLSLDECLGRPDSTFAIDVMEVIG